MEIDFVSTKLRVDQAFYDTLFPKAIKALAMLVPGYSRWGGYSVDDENIQVLVIVRLWPSFLALGV